MFASFSAMQMQQVARGWLTAELTGDAALALGVVALAFGLPQLLFSLFGGAFADRFEKRRIMIFAQVAMGLLALFNAVLVHMGVIQVWHLFVLGLFQGSIFAFNMPARQAFLPEILGERDLMNGIALNNAAMNVTRIAAPSLAGVLIAIPFVGLTGVYYLIAACYLVVIVSMLQLPKSRTHPERVRQPMVKEIGVGLSYIRSSHILMTLIGLAFVATFLGMPYMTLLPIFARTVHHVGSEGLGLMSTLAGVGALIGSLFVAGMSEHRRKTQLQLLAGIGFGLSLLLFASAVNFPIALSGLMLMGFSQTFFMATNNTLVMLNTSPEYHGRVMSVYMMTFSFMPVAALPMSVLADAVGAPWTLSVAGGLVAAIIFTVSVLNPKYRQLETAPRWSQEEQHLVGPGAPSSRHTAS
jgi:MFS family permease